MEIKVYETKPEDFDSNVQAAACYIEIDHKLLLLQIAAHKSEAGRWGVPAGKLEQGESPEKAAIRELAEETGISLDRSCFSFVGSLYMRKPSVDYVYHMFHVQIVQAPVVHLSDEHQAYKWASLIDLEKMPLMAGAKEALQQYRKMEKFREH